MADLLKSMRQPCLFKKASLVWHPLPVGWWRRSPGLPGRGHIQSALLYRRMGYTTHLQGCHVPWYREL